LGGETLKDLEYWNHNTVYYNWIKKQLKRSNRILDVGCGNGFLIRYLDDGTKFLVGIDSDKFCIEKAKERNVSQSCSFFCCDYEDFNDDEPFDAIIFVASIHHMNMRCALKKAKSMLSRNGILIIVGLAIPSNLMDYVIEAIRIIPCMIISKIKKERSSEDEHIPVCYNFPHLADVRKVISEELPRCEFRMGLYYRYLLKWEKIFEI
jgi:methionine biosynthesis protein metW